MSSYCHPVLPRAHKIINGNASFLAAGPIQALSHDSTLPPVPLCLLLGPHLVTLLGHRLVRVSGFTKSMCSVTHPKPTAIGTCLVKARTFLFWQHLQSLEIRSSLPPILGPGAFTLPHVVFTELSPHRIHTQCTCPGKQSNQVQMLPYIANSSNARRSGPPQLLGRPRLHKHNSGLFPADACYQST